MKSYTDIEQSKNLAEILPLESADKLPLGSLAKDKSIIFVFPFVYLLIFNVF